MRMIRHLFALLGLLAACSPALHAETYSFGVLSQRSAVLTAQYWNPILEHVKQKTGIELVLKLARTAPESSDATERGEYDFVYSNHIFQPRMARANYQVILRPLEDAITGQIVVMEDAPFKSMKELEGKEIGFPSAQAFVSYSVLMDQLVRQGVSVTPVFGGNQEGIMGQLKAGRVHAAGVNGALMKAFAYRENIKYRVLWETRPFLNLPIAVHPRVPQEVASKVRQAIDAMEKDPEGLRILEASGRIVGQKAPYGFRASSPEEYQSYVDFYKNTVLKDLK